MKALNALALVILTTSVTPMPLAAKQDTLKISISGGTLAAPVEMTDPGIRRFAVWSGPGVFRNGAEETEGFIIDWAQKVADGAPKNLQLYEVSFYSTVPAHGEPSAVYVVSYAYDPSSRQGFVYLPGKSDRQYERNTRTILHGHGLEGNRFRATSDWENFVRLYLSADRTSR